MVFYFFINCASTSMLTPTSKMPHQNVRHVDKNRRIGHYPDKVHIRCLQHKSFKNKPFHLRNYLQLTIAEDIVREIQRHGPIV